MTATVIARALAMPLEERRERWTAMMARIEDNSVGHWCANFVEALAEDGFASQPAEALALSRDGEAGRTAGSASPWSRARN